MTTAVENLKSEISDCYVKDLKKQLGWFKSIAVLPIQKPIKDILVGKKKMPESFDEAKEFGWRKDIIKFVSPEVANQIFEFMKSKRLEIEKRKTEAELIQLKNEILGLSSELTNSDAENNGEGSPDGEGDGNLDDGEGDGNSEDGEGNADGEGDGNSEDGEGNADGEGNGNSEDGEGNADGAGNGNSENGEGNADSESENSDSTQGTDQGDEGVNGVTAGVETAVGGGAGTLALEKMASKNLKAIEQLDPEKMRSTIESVIRVTEKKKEVLAHRLNTKQLKTVDKHIANLKLGLNNIDTDAVELLKERNKLGDKLKISSAILEQCGLTAEQLSEISKIADDLVGKPKDEVKAILATKGIKSVDDSIIEAFCKAENASEIKVMTKILKHGNKIPRMLQTLAGALWIDVAFTGIDVWMFIEQKKEAELISKVNELRGKNKYQQAWTQLGIGISSVAIEGLAIWLMGSAAAGGPIGMAVGLAVGALTMAASMSVDSLYFDVKDFYLQNQEDFLRQSRAQLKQAILQGIHNKKQGDQSLNEHVTSFLSPSLKPGTQIKEKSLNDACVSMIFLEEIDEGGQFAYNSLLWEYVHSNKSKKDFLSDKDENYKNNFEQVWKSMEKRISIRMQYVREELKKPDIIVSLDSGFGMQYLTTIFTNSRAFAELKEAGSWNDSKSFEKNLQDYKSELMSHFSPEKVAKFETLRQNNPSLFQEIITTVSLDDFIYGEEDKEENENYNYVQNVKMVVAYKKRLEMSQNVENKRYLYIDEVKNSRFIEDLLKVDFDLNKVEYLTINPENVVGEVAGNWERNGLTDISDDPLQNILYRLARELFGYSGENDMQGLMGFFSESKGDNHGIYYSGKWKINNDWVIDLELINNIPENLHEADVDKYVDTIIENFYESKQGYLLDHKKRKESIDTPTESIDDDLNEELISRFKDITKEELLNHTVERQGKIKNQILNFVKHHSKNGEYIELPYFLILDAKKSGLGDLQRQFFKRENNKLEICYLPSELNQTALFQNAEKSYVSQARESFTEEEQYYIDRVDEACKKIEALRSVNGENMFGFQFDDELDISIDIEHLISEKVNQRKIFKQNMLLYNEYVVHQSILKCKDFADYFENLYKGILTLLMGFKASNDIDDFSLFSQCLSYGNQDIFDDSGNIIPVDSIKILNDSAFKEFYDEQIKTLKIGTKTIKELWMSDNVKEKELAKQASNTIYIKVLERCLLRRGTKGQILEIRHGGQDIDEPNNFVVYNGARSKIKASQKRKYEKEGIITELTNRFNKMEVEPDVDFNKVKSMVKHQEIKKLNQKQRETTDITPKIQKQIENTMKNVDWRYKRGDIQFDPEKSTLKSWGYETKIILPKDGNITTMKLDGLDLDLSLEEGLRLANFRNWIKYTYGGQRVEYTRGVFNRKFAYRKTFYVGNTMLIARKDLERYCTVCENDGVMEKIKTWLNK